MNEGNEQIQTDNVPADENWMGNDGTFGDMSTAPETVRDFVTKKGFKNLEAQITSHQELESRLGNQDNMVSLPKEGDTEAEHAFNVKMGMPGKAEDYKLNIGEKSALKDETALIDSFKRYAHQGGMPQKGFDAVVNFYESAMAEGEKEYQKQMDEAQEAIKERFDTEDKYTEYTKNALGFAEQFKLDNDRSVADVIEDKGLAHDPEILEMLTALSDSTSEDALPRTETSVKPNRSEQIKAITNNPAFTNAGHPDHEKVMAEWKALFAPQKG